MCPHHWPRTLEITVSICSISLDLRLIPHPQLQSVMTAGVTNPSQECKGCKEGTEEQTGRYAAGIGPSEEGGVTDLVAPPLGGGDRANICRICKPTSEGYHCLPRARRGQLSATYCLPQSMTLHLPLLGFHCKLLCKFSGTPGHQDLVS